MNDLSWQEFERVELRVGTVVTAEVFKEARKPAIKLTIDFGDEIGTRNECLVTGFLQDDGSIILAVPDKIAKNGSRLA